MARRENVEDTWRAVLYSEEVGCAKHRSLVLAFRRVDNKDWGSHGSGMCVADWIGVRLAGLEEHMEPEIISEFWFQKNGGRTSARHMWHHQGAVQSKHVQGNSVCVMA